MDEVYRKLREGSDEEAREVYKTLMNNALRSAVAAIASRNFSHNIGENIKKYALND